MAFAALPDFAVYLDDRRAPFVDGWDWVRTVAELCDRLRCAAVEHVSLDYDLACSDHLSGLDAVRFMDATGLWPTVSLQLHTGDYTGRDKMAVVVADSGLFIGPEDHPLGHIYRRR